MTLQDLKSKIWSACDILRSQGLHITDYMEQITYLMFLKNLDEKEENDKELDKALGREHKPLFDDEKYYWKNWTQKSGRPLIKFVKNDLFPKLTDVNGRNPIVKKIFNDAVFTIEEPQALKKVIGIIDSIQFYKQPIDVKGATYEFLLSKLAEAGAAGEFFTPRHIIKAMIEIVDPKIGETICDPAMGTGGFLIGALNHILKTNGGGHDDGRNLTNEQFAFLHNETFFGYEQNRRTYRMALMNMYLHGANNPKLERINTLGDGTHTERKYDVIFANPPYGGKIDNVRGNFTISTNKTELLFLQHIIQTLKEGGRAGVILPEGVMFQSGAAQKIREILLNQCETFTVVSMPAGVFQPYTGVKTDLLFFKKGLGTQKVWFFDVKNDGFDLGSQRRPTKQNDLPALWDKFPFKGKNDFTPPKDEKELAKAESEKSWWADIEEIKENNWSLVAGRYKKLKIKNKNIKEYSFVDFCKLKQGKSLLQKDFIEGECDVFGANGKIGKHNKYMYDNEMILIACRGATCGAINKTTPKSWVNNNAIALENINEKIVDKDFLFYLLNHIDFSDVITGSAQPQITVGMLSNKKIPLPPIEVQKEIVKKLEQKNAIIEDAKSLIDKIERERANAQEIFDELDCELVELGEITELITKGTTPTTYGHNFTTEGVSFIKIENITSDGEINPSSIMHISKETNNSLKRSILQKGDVLMSIAGAIGRSAVVSEDILPANTNQAISIIRLKEEFLPEYVSNVLNSSFVTEQLDKFKVGVAQKNVNLQQVGQIKIPALDINNQQKVIEFFDKKRRLVNSLKENIIETEKSMQKIIAKLFEK